MLAAGALAAGAQAGAEGGAIYSCTDAAGKRLTSDRPIAECTAREQRVLNADGSVRSVLPPTLTAEERAEQDARDRRATAARSAQLEAVRRDRTLMLRYPDESAHALARAAAVDDVRKAMRLSALRMAALATERKPLVAETEFYVGKPLPPELKRQLDANDASTDAQRTLIQNQEAELVRINTLYDVELARLRKLWAGAAPGSVAQAQSNATTGGTR